MDVAKYLFDQAGQALLDGDEELAEEFDAKIGELWDNLTEDEQEVFNDWADAAEPPAVDEEDDDLDDIEEASDATPELSLEEAMDLYELGEDINLSDLDHSDKKAFIEWRKENYPDDVPEGVNPPDARENHAGGEGVHVNSDGEEITELEAAGLSDKLCEELGKLYQVYTFEDASYLTASQVKDIKGIGKKKLEALDEELEKRGLSFAEEATVRKVTELSTDEKRARDENGVAKIKKGLAAPTKMAKSRSSQPTLYVDCKPTFRSVTKMSSIIRDVNKAVSELNGVQDFRQIEYGAGRDEVVATIVGMVEDGELDGQSLYLNSRLPVQTHLLEAITPLCGEIYIASNE